MEVLRRKRELSMAIVLDSIDDRYEKIRVNSDGALSKEMS